MQRVFRYIMWAETGMELIQGTMLSISKSWPETCIHGYYAKNGTKRKGGSLAEDLGGKAKYSRSNYNGSRLAQRRYQSNPPWMGDSWIAGGIYHVPLSLIDVGHLIYAVLMAYFGFIILLYSQCFLSTMLSPWFWRPLRSKLNSRNRHR
jgi:hypothetical protein